jgi:hypothetical protein
MDPLGLGEGEGEVDPCRHHEPTMQRERGLVEREREGEGKVEGAG